MTPAAPALIHPGYLSARVTLGRALLELNDLDAAELELGRCPAAPRRRIWLPFARWPKHLNRIAAQTSSAEALGVLSKVALGLARHASRRDRSTALRVEEDRCEPAPARLPVGTSALACRDVPRRSNDAAACRSRTSAG